ncbi:MAG: serine/threonine-protein kinase [Gemmatimonadaceae bacterium]
MTAPNASNGLVGQIIADRYRIDKKLGGGGMGEVYLAEHVRIKRKCAIKVLRAALTDDDDSVERFNREAQNASLISHPNVAQVYDFGEHGNLLYLCMEFIEGQSMQEVIEKDGVMHPDMVADVIMQSASALGAAHDQHVLHRDIKPDNIMLARNTDGTYRVKLVDFGIARAMASTDKRMTQTGMVVGTPEFMSPEQIAGEPLDERSDLYSLALVAFVGLTGDNAFPDTGSMESLILRLTSRPRTLIEVRQSVSWPPMLQTVFDKALSPDREHRHGTAVEFASDLSGAIVQMSPTETSAFYRKALEVRSINPVALTPSATPAKASSSRTRDNASAKSNDAAPPTRPMGMRVNQTQVAYTGPAMKSSKLRQFVFLGLFAAGVGIWYFDKEQVVLGALKPFGEAAMGLVGKLRQIGVDQQTKDSTVPVVPAEATVQKSRPKPKPAVTTTKKPDSVTTPPAPPKDSGSIPPGTS